jgi:hypothetical protein
LGDQFGAGRGGEPGHRGEPAADDDALVGSHVDQRADTDR